MTSDEIIFKEIEIILAEDGQTLFDYTKKEIFDFAYITSLGEDIIQPQVTAIELRNMLDLPGLILFPENEANDE